MSFRPKLRRKSERVEESDSLSHEVVYFFDSKKVNNLGGIKHPILRFAQDDNGGGACPERLRANTVSRGEIEGLRVAVNTDCRLRTIFVLQFGHYV